MTWSRATAIAGSDSTPQIRDDQETVPSFSPSILHRLSDVPARKAQLRMPGEFHRSSVHCVKERLDLEVVPISLCSALTFLGSRRLSNVCWNQPVRVLIGSVIINAQVVWSALVPSQPQFSSASRSHREW
jgi:hypothetical protein